MHRLLKTNDMEPCWTLVPAIFSSRGSIIIPPDQQTIWKIGRWWGANFGCCSTEIL